MSADTASWFNEVWPKGSEQPFPDWSFRMQQLVTGIVASLPPDEAQELQRLSPVVSVGHTFSTGATSRLASGPSLQIVFDAGLIILIQAYIRAAATRFLPVTHEGSRPSEFWPLAKRGMGTMLDWLFSPDETTRCPRFDASPEQVRRAEILTLFAIRFVVCHELAHFILGHHGPDTPRVPSDRFPGNIGFTGPNTIDLEVLEITREMELDADSKGLWLQQASLPDESQVVNGLAGAVYFLHASGLLSSRLMFRSSFADISAWRTPLTHPPTLARVAFLMASAQEMYQDAFKGLNILHEGLAELDQEIHEAASILQSDVKEKMHKYLDDIAGTPWSNTSGIDQTLAELLRASPIGVMEVLRGETTSPKTGPAFGEGPRLVAVKRIRDTLPLGFQRWLNRL